MLVEREDQELSLEIVRKQEMEECNYCKQKNEKISNYEEEIQLEKERECLKALEREKIAKGMRCTKEDEIRLQEVQIMQMNEKKLVEKQEQFDEMMWHQVLMRDVHRKEEMERMKEQRKHQAMLERRTAYNEQIANAHIKRQQTIREEREKENRRLERIKKKMEEDHCNEFKRKKEQQLTNRINFIEGHKMKQTRLKNEKLIERKIDNAFNREALEELRKARESKIRQIHDLQTEKQVFVENYNRERRIACALDEEADRAFQEWKQNEENKNDDYIKRLKDQKLLSKKRAAKEYEIHIDNVNSELARAKRERNQRMELVKKNAFHEMQTKLHKANMELQSQIEYRHSLAKQINDNQRYLDSETADIECRDRPFTKRAIMFNDAMANLFHNDLRRTSTNPVHPFKMAFECQGIKSSLQLPRIKK